MSARTEKVWTVHDPSEPIPGFVLYRDIETTPRKDWLIAGMLGLGEQSCEFGAPGTGKSVLCGDLAAHVAAGLPWFGRQVTQGAVLHVALERAAVVKRRYAAWRLHHKIDDIPLAVVSGQYDLCNSTTDADKIADLAQHLEQITGVQVALIIIETVNRALAGGDENSPKDMGALVANITRIQGATDAHVMVVHHIPADGTQRLRGHGALLGAMDVTICVEKRGKLRSGTVSKSNDGEEGIGVMFDLASVDLHHDPLTGITTTAPVVIPQDGKPPAAEKKAGRPPKAAQIAERALKEALDECGESAPASNHIPASARIVSIDKWRDYAFRRGISASEEPDARRKAFQRASEYLFVAGAVATWDGQVWITQTGEPT